MREVHVMVADVLSAELDALHRRHGPWRLMRALVATIFRQSFSARNHSTDLDNYMRRDIGLPEVSPHIESVERARFQQWKQYL